MYLVLGTIFALLLSVGLRFNLDGIQPYQWIRDYIPGFAQLRSPFRFAVFVQIHVALLAGFGMQNLARWLRSWQAPLSMGLAAIVLFEALALPLPLQSVPMLSQNIPWQQWINAQQPPTRIVFLPFAPKSGVASFEQTTRWMLGSYQLQGDLLNGYSGFFPPDHGYVREQMLVFPTDDGLELLAQKGVDYVVLFERLPNAPNPQKIATRLRLVYRDPVEQISIYGLRNGN